jgi:hypothetical protein
MTVWTPNEGALWVGQRWGRTPWWRRAKACLFDDVRTPWWKRAKQRKELIKDKIRWEFILIEFIFYYLSLQTIQLVICFSRYHAAESSCGTAHARFARSAREQLYTPVKVQEEMRTTELLKLIIFDRYSLVEITVCVNRWNLRDFINMICNYRRGAEIIIICDLIMQSLIFHSQNDICVYEQKLWNCTYCAGAWIMPCFACMLILMRRY